MGLFYTKPQKSLVDEFLANGGEITTDLNWKNHLIKKQRSLGQPTIIQNDYSDKEFEERLHNFYNSKTWKILKEQVYKTLTHMCPVCGAEENLVVDHIKPIRHYPNLIVDMNNLQILCDDCNLEKGSMIDWTLEWHIRNKEYLTKIRIRETENRKYLMKMREKKKRPK